MKSKKTLILLCICSIVLLQTGVSVAADDAVQKPVVSESEISGASGINKSGEGAAKVPRLAIKWDCGACVVNEKVIPQFELAYLAEAAKNRLVISNEDVAEISIVEYRQRPPGLRLSFGIFAGKDILGVKIRYKDKEFSASDYMANSFQGMNALCESVALMTYQKIVEASAFD